ncbi:MAG: ADP-ribosylation factor-like protein [Candidatus Thorarchaeota archaeon]
MIHNTLLVRISTKEVLASTQYWPVEVLEEELLEYLSTRAELKIKHGADMLEMPLIVGDMKFMADDWLEDALLIFVTDKREEERNIADKLEMAAKALRRKLKKDGLQAVIDSYEQLVEPCVITRLKIALVGEGGTGKTTTLNLLLGETPPLQYVPTIALNLETVENIRFGNYSLVLWDFAGQERFRTLWRFYFHGADVIFLVCDSSLRNVIISRDILKLIRRDAPKVPVFALANKQDLPNAMRPEVVGKILGVPTYPMVAIDENRRDEMLSILMTAAAQYIGVVLPDMPASELLQFTEVAEAEAIEAYAEEEVYEEIVEEVFVDEDGKIIEDISDYEVIEDVAESADVPAEADATADAFEIVTESVSTPEEDEVRVVAKPEDAVTTEAESEPSETPVTFEIDVVTAETAGAIEDSSIDVEILSEGLEDAERDEVEIETTPMTDEDETTTLKLAKDFLSDVLDADDIIAAELDKATIADVDGALEALSSDEVIPVEGENDAPESVEMSIVEELDQILGYLEDDADSAEDISKTEEAMDIDNDAIKELWAAYSETEKTISKTVGKRKAGEDAESPDDDAILEMDEILASMDDKDTEDSN